MNMPNIVLRIIFGAILVAVIVAAIMFRVEIFGLVFSIISMLAVREFHTLTNRKGIQVPIGWAMFSALVLFATSYCFFTQNLMFAKICAALYMLLILSFAVIMLFFGKEQPITIGSYYLVGQVWIAFPFALLCGLEYHNHEFTPLLTLSCFVTIWCNDTFAYCFGRMFGKHKLFERISPKKTWEGFFGGAFGALVSALIFNHFTDLFSLWQWIIIAEAVVIFGTFGDLVESQMKRTIGVKDSGNAIPGHGGWLDRFDSMLLAAPAIFLTLLIISAF